MDTFLWILMQIGVFVGGILLTFAYFWVISKVYHWVVKS